MGWPMLGVSVGLVGPQSTSCFVPKGQSLRSHFVFFTSSMGSSSAVASIWSGTNGGAQTGHYEHKQRNAFEAHFTWPGSDKQNR